MTEARTARRRIPLRTTCARPHSCPRPVRMDVLRRVPYLAGLSEEELGRVDARMVSLAWAAGDPIYRAGEPAEHLYVVASGRVKVSRPTPTGAPVVTDVLVPGRLFGAMTTLGEPEHAETAEALVTTCALRIDQAGFRQVLLEHPTVAVRVLDDVADRLARSRSALGRQVSGTVAERVAAVLLRLADDVGRARPGGGTLIEVPLSRADLAGLSGSTPESVSRVMSRWREAGLISSGRRWTAVLDREGLARVAGA